MQLAYIRMNGLRNQGRLRMFELIKEFLRDFGVLKKPKETVLQSVSTKPTGINFMDEIELLRNRIIGVGWKLQELPIRGGVKGYRVVAARGERTISADGPTLHESLKQLGKVLGVR